MGGYPKKCIMFKRKAKRLLGKHQNRKVRKERFWRILRKSLATLLVSTAMGSTMLAGAYTGFKMELSGLRRDAGMLGKHSNGLAILVT